MDSSGCEWIGVDRHDWNGLGWLGVDRSGWHWIGGDSSALQSIQMDLSGLEWIGMDWGRLEYWSGLGCIGTD